MLVRMYVFTYVHICMYVTLWIVSEGRETLFTLQAPFMKIYTQYVSSYETAIALYSEHQRNKSFVRILTNLNKVRAAVAFASLSCVELGCS